MPSALQLGARFVGAFAVLFSVPSLLLGWLRSAGIVGPEAPWSDRVEWSMAAFGAAAGLVVLGASTLWPAAPWRPLRARAVLAVYAPFALLWTGVLVAYLLGARALGFAIEPQGGLVYVAEGDPSRPGYWVVVLAVVVAAPFVEEVVFRGYLQGALQRRLPRSAAIVVAGVAFGMVHSLAYAVPVTLLGVLFGWIFARHGGLFAPILAHALHNGATLLVTACWPAYLDLLYTR